MKWHDTTQGRFEMWLREKGWPFVSIDETKKAIFADAAIGSFHFLAYSESGPNLLCIVRPKPTVRKPDLDLLTEWEEVFGGDFIGCFVWPDNGTGGWRALTTRQYRAGRKPRHARELDILL